MSKENRPIGLSIEEADLVVRAIGDRFRYGSGVQDSYQNVWNLLRRIELESLKARSRMS